jgi:hypothetical protein
MTSCIPSSSYPSFTHILGESVVTKYNVPVVGQAASLVVGPGYTMVKQADEWQRPFCVPPGLPLGAALLLGNSLWRVILLTTPRCQLCEPGYFESSLSLTPCVVYPVLDKLCHWLMDRATVTTLLCCCGAILTAVGSPWLFRAHQRTQSIPMLLAPSRTLSLWGGLEARCFWVPWW